MVIITAKITHKNGAPKETDSFYHTTGFGADFYYWSWTAADVFDSKEEAEQFLKEHPPKYEDPDSIVSAPRIIELPL